MDMSDISKVANRKRMHTDVEKLREKVSRETAKIIKLKVAQDTAYWDVQEKLAQTEGARERLRQNMVDVAMQHEAASLRLHNELRMRPDTLNKARGTRDMCAALERYGARLQRGAARCGADAAALGSAYGAAAQRVRDLTADAQRRAQLLRERVRAAEAREADAATRATDAAEARASLAAAQRDARRRDEEIAALRDEVRRVADERDERATEARAAAAERAERERRASEAERAAEALRASLQRATAAEETARERGEDLRRRLVDEEKRAVAAEREGALLRERAREADEEAARAAATLQRLTDRVRVLEDAAAGGERRTDTLRTECETLETKLAETEADRARLDADLERARRELEARDRSAREAAVAAGELDQRLRSTEETLEAHRVASEREARELREALAARDAELEDKVGAVTRLMAELRGEGEARARADAAAAQLRATVAERDRELADAERAARELRAEQERLQERIRGMQATIDDIQKLTGRAPADPVDPRDVAEKPEEGAPAPAARPPPPPDALYNFLSDSSVDGEALDAEVRRRFESLSRGAPAPLAMAMAQPRRPPSPLSLSQLKSDLKKRSRAFFKNKRLDDKPPRKLK